MITDIDYRSRIRRDQAETVLAGTFRVRARDAGAPRSDPVAFDGRDRTSADLAATVSELSAADLEPGTKHSFHRQFNERQPFMAGQVLGMQLCVLVAGEAAFWV